MLLVSAVFGVLRTLYEVVRFSTLACCIYYVPFQ